MTWDYRCPFARIAHEHLITALEDGAPWDVTFVPFFLNQPHVPEGGVPAWEDPDQAGDLLALAAGVAVRDGFPEAFPAAHRALFTARHVEGADLRQRGIVAGALSKAGLDADAVLAEVDGGLPTRRARSEHEDIASRLGVFGVPTFIVGDRAVFVRWMTGPDGDARLARATVEHVLDLMTGHPELNEFKYTRVAS